MTLPDRKVYVYEQYSKEFEDNFLNSISILSKKASRSNLRLSIENNSNFHHGYIQKIIDKSISYPNVGLTWDTGHDALSGFTDRQYLQLHENEIIHMHLHDAIGTKDHQILFEGSLDIQKLFAFAKQKKIRALVEVKTADALEKSISALENINKA